MCNLCQVRAMTGNETYLQTSIVVQVRIASRRGRNLRR